MKNFFFEEMNCCVIGFLVDFYFLLILCVKKVLFDEVYFVLCIVVIGNIVVDVFLDFEIGELSLFFVLGR